jgi:hypothetical protein
MCVLAFFRLLRCYFKNYTPLLTLHHTVTHRFSRTLGTPYSLLIRLVQRLPTAKPFKSSAGYFAHLPEFLTS